MVTADGFEPGVECGKGLHFVPAPIMGLQFDTEATRFVACDVPIAYLSIHAGGAYPFKATAPVCFVVAEVDIDGNPLNTKS
jgi:hypothetical protein